MNTKAILIAVVSMVAIASLSVIIFMHYGGNACDQPPEFTCDCFAVLFLDHVVMKPAEILVSFLEA